MHRHPQLMARLIRSDPRDALTFAGLLGALGPDMGRDPVGDGQACAAWPDAARVPYLNARDLYFYLPLSLARVYARSAAWPYFRSVRVAGTGAELAAWLAATDLSNITTLTLRATDRFGPALAGLSADAAPALRDLALEWHRSADADLPDFEHFLDGGAARSLSRLRVSARDRGVRRAACSVVAAGRLHRLTALALDPIDGLADVLARLAGRPLELHLERSSATGLAELRAVGADLGAVTELSVYVGGEGNALLPAAADRLTNVRKVTCTLPSYDLNAQTFFSFLRAHRTVTDAVVRFREVTPDLARADTRPTTRSSLRRLTLSHTESPPDLAEDPDRYDAPLAGVLSSFWTTGLEFLGLDRCATGRASADAVAPFLGGANLRGLALSGCVLGPAPPLFAADHCAALESLQWSYMSGGGGVLADFLKRPHPSMHSLTIDSPQTDDLPPAAFTGAPVLGNLSRLELSGCGLRPADAAALSRSVSRHLVELSLSANTELDEASLIAFLDDSGLDSLLSLDVSDVQLSDRFLRHLASRPGSDYLVSLDVAGSLDESGASYPNELVNHPSLQWLSPPLPGGVQSANPILSEARGG